MEMQGIRTGAAVVIVGARTEVEMRTGVRVRVEMVLNSFRRRSGAVRGRLPLRREVEKRRVRRSGEILVEEAVQRKADGPERVEISSMGLGEGETLSYGFLEESAAVAA